MKKIRIPEESVSKATGKGWDHWVGVLDRFGCKEKGHKESAKHLQDRHGVAPWWAQTITVEYEVAMGIRKPGQRSDDKFGLDVHRTVNAPIETCWRAFTTKEGLESWFNSNVRVDPKIGGRYTGAGGDKCTFKIVEPMERLVFTWENPKHKPGSIVEVRFKKLDKSKSRVHVSHTKISGQAEMADLKRAWSGIMDDFKRVVESS